MSVFTIALFTVAAIVSVLNLVDIFFKNKWIKIGKNVSLAVFVSYSAYLIYMMANWMVSMVQQIIMFMTNRF